MARRLEATPGGGMSCADVLERLEAFVDGDLSAREAAAIEAHLRGALEGEQLAGCPACAAEHRLATAVRRELRALPELDAPPVVLREIMLETQRERFREPPVREIPTRRRSWMRLAAAMLATAMLGGGLWWGSLRQDPALEPSAVADAARVAQATEEARYALAYLNRVNRRAGLKLRDDLFVDRVARPAARGLSRSLSPHLAGDGS